MCQGEQQVVVAVFAMFSSELVSYLLHSPVPLLCGGGRCFLIVACTSNTWQVVISEVIMMNSGTKL